MHNLVVGVDVGGTNTDAVLLRSGKVISASKQFTTKDVTSGIVAALRAVTEAVPTEPIDSVMIGTTHFVNAVVQRSSQLQKVAVIRLCGPASFSVPPFIDIPIDLNDIIHGYYACIDGGYEVDGREITSVKPKQVVAECKVLKEKKLYNIVVSGIFSPVNAEQEQIVADIIKTEIPEAQVTLSHELARLGLLERENVSILNASIRPLAKVAIQAFRDSLHQLGSQFADTKLYITQNDGTLMSSEFAKTYPVYTFASGPTNSMRGAAYLSGVKDAIVVDIGGTSVDCGTLVKGFPRQSSAVVEVGEVRTNFRMPDVFSFAMGGGTKISQIENIIKIGPESVGYELINKAKIFGGDTLTATDIAVAKGYAIIGDLSKVADLEPAFVDQVIKEMKQRVEAAIDTLKLNNDPVEVILVGGGSILIDNNIRGASKVIRPPYYDVANAVGAAIAQVSASVDVIMNTTNTSREQILQSLKNQVTQKLVELHAIPESIEITEIDEIAIGYLAGSYRYHVKGVGSLGTISSHTETLEINPRSQNYFSSKTASFVETKTESEAKNETSIPPAHDATIDPNTKEWILTEQDIEFIAVGAGILGTGGGGTAYYAKLKALNLIRKGKKIRVINSKALNDDDIVFPVGFMGAPTEKQGAGTEFVAAVKALEKISGKAKAICVAEIGGGNAIEPLFAGALLDLPIVDADGMGRAFPELQMYTPVIYGLDPFPAALCDEKGNSVILASSAGSKWLENLMRVVVTQYGGVGALALLPLTGSQVKSIMMQSSLSRAWYIGKAVYEAKRLGLNPNQEVCKITGGKIIFHGKVVDVVRETSGGFAKGNVTLDGLAEFEGKTMTIDFQNENLVARMDGKTLASVPDLITISDSITGNCFFTEQIKYGLRATVIWIAADPLLCTEKALSIVGPAVFGYKDVTFTPLDTQPPTTSIFD